MAPTSPGSALLVRLLLATAGSMLAAACDDGPDPNAAEGSAGSAGTGGSSVAAESAGAAGAGPGGGSAAGSAGAAGAGPGGNSAAGSAPWSTFEPIPVGSGATVGGYPDCDPEPAPDPSGHPPLSGPCCTYVECRKPGSDALCPAASTVSIGIGSGTCSCGPSTGPYQPGAAEAGAVAEGRGCCYLARMRSCSGRPVLVAGEARVAPLVTSAAWG